MKNNLKTKKGIALYLSILVLGFLLLIGMALSFIFSFQIQALKIEENKKIAEGATDSGIEEGFYQFYAINGGNSSTSFSGKITLPNNSSSDYEGTATNCSGIFCINSTGFYLNSKVAKRIILY